MTKKLILASASPRRLALLQQAGVEPDAVAPADIDEMPAKGELPAAYVRRMAEEKALAAAGAHAGCFILSADTVVAAGRRILPKTETEEEARMCLGLLSGRRHDVLTGVTLILPNGDVRTRIVPSVVQFKRLSTRETDDYIASGEWKGKAGGYAIQGRAAILVPYIRGSYTGIVGLPLHETLGLLKGSGYGA